jgi:E3 ubiquitin-protein ligase synoviolin
VCEQNIFKIMGFARYFALSLLATISTVIYAVYTREQFYPVILFLVSSKVSYVVNANFILALTLLMARLTKSVFLGKLRDVEVEMLYERGQYAFVEICIALTVFRSEGINPTVVTLLWALLFCKAFHWLGGARLDYLDQIMPTSSWAHIRLGTLLVMLGLTDMCCTYYAIQHCLTKGRSVIMLFGFEFGLLCITSFNLVSRFVLHVIDIRLPNGLLSKGLITMVLDLVCDAFRFVTYIFFVGVVVKYYGIPIHILREVYVSFYTFQKHLFSFIRYLRLTKNLDQRFPSATPEVRHIFMCACVWTQLLTLGVCLCACVVRNVPLLGTA